MSRTYSIDLNNKNIIKDITLKDLLNALKELNEFDITKIDLNELKIFNNGNLIEHDSDILANISMNIGHNAFLINENYVHIDFNNHYNEGFYWVIESRALEGIDKDLFIAIACSMSNLVDGYITSCDGAWIPDPNKCYSGLQLWNEYLKAIYG